MAILPEPNPIITAVITALRVLGCFTRTNADALLSLTVVDLSARERLAVLADFPDDEGAHIVRTPDGGSAAISRREAWRRLVALITDGLPDPHEVTFRTTDASSAITVYVDSAAAHDEWTSHLGLDLNPLVALPDGSVVYRSWGTFGGWFLSVAAMVTEAEIPGGDR